MATRKIHHMGMTLTKEEHDRFHKKGGGLNPEQHDALMRRLGVAKEEDEEWHRTHLTLGEQRALAKGLKPVNAFALGGGFLAWCEQQGWLVQQRKHYYATAEGVRELRARFGIEV